MTQVVEARRVVRRSAVDRGAVESACVTVDGRAQLLEAAIERGGAVGERIGQWRGGGDGCGSRGGRGGVRGGGATAPALGGGAGGEGGGDDQQQQ